MVAPRSVWVGLNDAWICIFFAAKAGVDEARLISSSAIRTP